MSTTDAVRRVAPQARVEYLAVLDAGADMVDLASAINGNSGLYADAIHLSGAGYAAVAAAFNTKMTELGWG